MTGLAATLALCVFLLASASAGVVEDWNAAFLQAVRKETPPPCLVSRNLPIMHLAMHRAVRACARAGLDEEAQRCAASHAGHSVFRTFFPSQAQVAEDCRAMHFVSPISLPKPASHEPQPEEWRKFADVAVLATLKEREDDGATTTIHYIPEATPGQWRRTPPTFRPPEFPHWGKVRPFVIKDAAQFRAPPPPPLDSPDYSKDVETVRRIGGSASGGRTPEQTLIARFWSDFSYTTSPAGHWNDIARSLSLQRKLNVEQSARLFALLNVALADTCIAIWETKYHYNYWRPITAIQRADEDGNGATQADKAWLSLLPCPPHPEYVSGHSGISGAAAEILKHFFGDQEIAFEAESDDVRDTKRRFTSFTACAEEIAQSRIFGGIHFPTAGREGLAMGRRIAAEVINLFRE